MKVLEKIKSNYYNDIILNKHDKNPLQYDNERIKKLFEFHNDLKTELGLTQEEMIFLGKIQNKSFLQEYENCLEYKRLSSRCENV